jgi:FkbM family methyltransferase
MKALARRLLATLGIEARHIPRNRYGWLHDLDINTVLDVGANTGQFASLIHGVLPESDIYSFEPIGDCFQELKRRMGHVKGFQAFQCALGERDGDVEMHRSEFSPSSSVLAMEQLHAKLFPHTAKTWVERIPMRTLDGVVAELTLRSNILIKIDVQGYEDRVIRGGRRAVGRARALIVEASFQRLYESQIMFDSLYKTLTELGFRYSGNMDQLNSPLNGSVVQCDAVFLRAS